MFCINSHRRQLRGWDNCSPEKNLKGIYPLDIGYKLYFFFKKKKPIKYFSEGKIILIGARQNSLDIKPILQFALPSQEKCSSNTHGKGCRHYFLHACFGTWKIQSFVHEICTFVTLNRAYFFSLCVNIFRSPVSWT